MLKKLQNLTLAVSFLMLFMVAKAQPKLVNDFTPGTGDSFDRWTYKGVKLGDGLIFTITSMTLGKELGYLNGSGMKLLKDINVGSGSSEPRNLTLFQNKIYFIAEKSADSYALWSTDGTTDGTKLEVQLPNGTSQPSELVVSKSNKLYYTYESKLYQYDGSTATVLDEGVNFAVNSRQASGNFCTYGEEIAYTKLIKDDSLNLHVIENGKSIKKKTISTGVDRFDNIFGLNEVKAGLIVCVEGSFDGSLTATYAYNKSNNSLIKLFSGSDTYAVRVEKFDKDRVLAAIYGEGYYALDGTTNGKVLIAPTTEFSYTQGQKMEVLQYKGKVLFVGSTGGFFSDPSLYYSDGTVAGTKEIKKLSNDYNSNFVREGNYAFWADNVSNGFEPNYYAVNLDNGDLKTLYTSTLSSNSGPSVLMLGVLAKKVYFISNLTPANGYEIYSLDFNVNITAVKEVLFPNNKINITNNQFEIISNTTKGLKVNFFSRDGRLLSAMMVKPNQKYDLPKVNTINYISAVIENQIVTKSFYGFE
jgi:ELWxxDGT repeat protein